MVWKVKFEKRAEKKFGKLDKPIQKRISSFIKDRLVKDPKKYSTLLVGNKDNISRARVGNYRILLQIKDKALIIILIDIEHCSKVYT
jgi:mRNA interferase RelE/StbE